MCHNSMFFLTPPLSPHCSFLISCCAPPPPLCLIPARRGLFRGGGASSPPSADPSSLPLLASTPTPPSCGCQEEALFAESDLESRGRWTEKGGQQEGSEREKKKKRGINDGIPARKGGKGGFGVELASGAGANAVRKRPGGKSFSVSPQA